MLNLFKQKKAPDAQLLFRGEKTSISDSFLIGRSVQCDMQLSDNQISRTHVEIIPDQLGNWWIHDLGSTNGTYINFVRTTQPTLLKNGDRINIGKYEIFFLVAVINVEENIINPPPFDEEIPKETKPYYFAHISFRAANRNGDDYDHDDIVKIGSAWFNEINKLVNSSNGEISMATPNRLLASFPKSISADRLIEWIEAIRNNSLSKEMDYRAVIHCGEMKIGLTDKEGNERLLGDDVDFIFRISEKAQSLGHRLILSETCAKVFIGRNINILGDFLIPGLTGKHSLYTLNES